MRHAPSAERNREPIADALARFPPFSGTDASTCLEIASGTGQHAAFFASRFKHMTIQPTEYSGGSAGPESSAYGSLEPVMQSIRAHSAGLLNVRPPIELDAAAPIWPVEPEKFGAILACNVCHISPYCVTEGLLAGSARVLCPGGGLFLYGPFKVDGQHTAPSNEAFDERLKGQNAEWGVRDSTTLAELAANHGMMLRERVEMPSNNFLLFFELVA